MDAIIQKRLNQCEKAIPYLREISNKTRLRILAILIEAEQKVGDIQNMLNAKQSYVSQQLKYLKDKGYVDCRREGTQIYYHLTDKRFSAIFENVTKNLK